MNSPEHIFTALLDVETYRFATFLGFIDCYNNEKLCCARLLLLYAQLNDLLDL